ncbi:MAG: NTP transferase domain-containing protein, partial [Mariprofundaceae bacterium]|nr:NTP transferase domain-containing protein [Mariprofundaceae bacterium]
MNIAVGIPARFASTRFPGKPLADLAGKAMIVHVIERAKQADIGHVFVATDDERIAAVARAA